MRRSAVPILVLLIASITSAAETGEAPKPRVAVLPLSGDASEKERERAAFSIRAKLDRQGVYEPIDGPTMRELLGETKAGFDTPAEKVKEWTADEKLDLIIWGQLSKQLQLHILDLRKPDAKPIDYVADIGHATDIRLAVEELIEKLPGSKKFEHMTEEAVVRDPAAEKAWEKGPNLMKEGAFDAAGEWRAILAGNKYPPEVVERGPNADEVVIRKIDKDQHVLSMKLSKDTAETYGLACLSGKIPIEPSTRYRISFRYKSDGPTIRPFIKGYFTHKGEEREIYRRQIPARAKTNGDWVEVIDELNPQHPTFKVEYLRVDFYAYLHPGKVEFDDVVIKAVGAQTRVAKDEALDLPVEKRE
jgi:hypothetical protein